MDMKLIEGDKNKDNLGIVLKCGNLGMKSYRAGMGADVWDAGHVHFEAMIKPIGTKHEYNH